MLKGICSVYCLEKKLSREHIPPRAAFNNNTVLLAKIDKERTVSEVRWKKKQKQGGNFSYTLCESCNSNTGSWYGDYYVDFVRQVAEHACENNGGKALKIAVNFYPSRVFKQALTILCSSCGPSLSEQFPDIKKIILNKDYCQKPANLNLWMYLRAHGGGRTSGRAGIYKINEGETQVVAEFSWWPVGWVLSFDDRDLPNLTNVTDWYSYGSEDKASIILNIHCHWAVTPYPLDYRDPETVANTPN